MRLAWATSAAPSRRDECSATNSGPPPSPSSRSATDGQIPRPTCALTPACVTKSPGIAACSRNAAYGDRQIFAAHTTTTDPFVAGTGSPLGAGCTIVQYTHFGGLMTLGDYLRAIRRSWLAIALLLMVGIAAGYVPASITPNSYRSAGAVLVTSDRGDSTSELVQGNAYVQNIVETYVLLARSEIVLQPVIDSLGLAATPQSLAETISASSPLNSTVIQISATSASPQLAQKIAAATMASLSSVVTSRVAPTDASGKPTIRLTVIENANEPKFAFAPNKRNYAMIGGVLGLVIGVAYSVLRAFAWQTVHSRADIRRLTATPVLGEVPEARRGYSLTADILADPLGVEAEALRAIAANLNFLKVDGGLKSIVATSASANEGKSVLSIALSIIVAESSKRVLLIDADLRSPSIARYTQLDGGVGLTNVLIGELTLADAAQDWGIPGLSVLVSGSSAPNPSQLVTSQRMTELLVEARALYDFVIIDCAPLLAVTDGVWLGNQTDGALLAVLHDKTRVHTLEKVLSTAQVGGLTVLGTVLTRVPRRGLIRYGVSTYGQSASASSTGGRRVALTPRPSPTTLKHDAS